MPCRESGDIRPDLDPFDLLRAGWRRQRSCEPGAKRLIDSLPDDCITESGGAGMGQTRKIRGCPAESRA
jgi:hypothetical protein